MSINLRGFEVGMAEPLANFVEGDPLLGKAGGEGMAELMPTHPSPFA